MSFRGWADRSILTKILHIRKPTISIGFCDANNYPSNTFVGQNFNSFGMSDEGTLWTDGRCVDPYRFRVIRCLTIFGI